MQCAINMQSLIFVKKNQKKHLQKQHTTQHSESSAKHGLGIPAALLTQELVSPELGKLHFSTMIKTSSELCDSRTVFL